MSAPRSFPSLPLPLNWLELVSEKSAAKPTPTHTTPKKTNADTTRHDTITGTLRIPVKPSVRSSAKPDSTRPDSVAKRPPHVD